MAARVGRIQENYQQIVLFCWELLSRTVVGKIHIFLPITGYINVINKRHESFGEDPRFHVIQIIILGARPLIMIDWHDEVTHMSMKKLFASWIIRFERHSTLQVNNLKTHPQYKTKLQVSEVKNAIVFCIVFFLTLTHLDYPVKCRLCGISMPQRLIDRAAALTKTCDAPLELGILQGL